MKTKNRLWEVKISLKHETHIIILEVLITNST